MKMDPPTIYLPDHAIDTIEQLLKVYRRLDRGRLPCELIPVKAGDEIELSRELVVTVSATHHTIPALGYIVWERKQKLKPEYLDLRGDQIRDLKLSGVEITDEVRVPELAYLGDSAPAGLDNCPEMYEARVLISEMTFVAPSHRKDKIHKHGHMHLDDYVDRKDRFKNERVIVGHFSTRYNSRQFAASSPRLCRTCWTTGYTCGCDHELSLRAASRGVYSRSVLPASLRLLQLHVDRRQG